MTMERKIGLVVEGDIDKVVVETLGRRVLGEGVRVYAVRQGGNLATRHTWATVQMLLDEKGYEHVIVLVDSDSILRREIDRKRAALEEQLAQHGFTDAETSVCTADPEVEAWLLTHFSEHPEESRDPKGEVARRIGRDPLTSEDAARIAEQIDLAAARRRSPSLDTFVATLERIARRSQHAPAA